ncbi:MAG TPA: manganese efflux pump [Trebonia sp.]|nr:manganese efflux pump [Trebonia sp.]
MTALVLVALALGIDNLAASVGIGVSGVRAAVRARVAIVFGVFEAGMPVLGMALGRPVSAHLGGTAQWLGGGLLVVVGLHQVVGGLRRSRTVGSRAADSRAADSRAAAPELAGGERDDCPAAPHRSWGTVQLLASGLALSIDNLVVGFALGTYHVSIEVATLVIGVVSVAMSLAGLELGARIGTALGERGALAGGIVLLGVGVVMAAGLL